MHSTSHRYITILALSHLGSHVVMKPFTHAVIISIHTQLHNLQVVRRPTKHKGKMNLNPVPPLSKDEPPMKVKFDGGNAFAKLPKRDKRAPRPGARIEEAFPK